jgi:uncharacterized protein YecE (DUF72 family)
MVLDKPALQSPILVGVGGWAYLPVRHQNKLQLCAKVYDFVEVNSTFYKLPLVSQARKWRESVSDPLFEFTMRANGKLTHENHLEPTNVNFKIFESNLAVSEALNATILHFQFPPSFKVTKGVIQNWKDFFGTAKRSRTKTNYAFEIRNTETANSDYVRSFLDAEDFILTEDASKSTPILASSRSRIAYSRVFGHGDHTKWNFSTDELEALKEKVESAPARRKYVTFHNMSMYEDGARLKSILKTGKDVLPPGDSGPDSFRRAIISARIEFPATKKELLRELSWRTIDTESGTRVHADRALEALPEDSKFESLDDLVDALATRVGQLR